MISTEARAFSNAGHAGLDYWTPNINPYRDPRWGRGMETPGEDPRRIKGYVKALVSGLEGDDPSKKKIVATCKHYAGNDIDRWEDVLRFNFSAVISLQDLVEYYLPPFQQCARDSRVGSIMCAYNAVNGTPACANTYLMQTVLRDHWGWNDENQYITSDCNAVGNFYADHHWVETAAEAAAKAYAAGTDTVCEVNMATDVIGAWNQSLLTEETIDRAVNRLYHGLVRVGYFDPPDSSEYRSLTWEDVNTEHAQQLALQSAVDGIVLLKNDDAVLPLEYDANTPVAVIGHWAEAPVQLLGGYAGTAPYYITPRSVAAAIHNSTHYANGPIAQDLDADDTWSEMALEAANNADIVFYFGGLRMTIEREDRDRTSIGWPTAQLSLIQKLCALGKPCIVIQMGDQIDDAPLLENKNVSAILWAGYPGQAGGAAVFDILYGKSAPAGRLPVTQYPSSYTEEVPMTDMTLRPSEVSPGRTYKWYSDAVLPFGHGLHYTTFEAAFSFEPAESYDIQGLIDGCQKDHLDLCPFETISVSVENTGDVLSDFVALVFANGTYGPSPHPLKELVGYHRFRGVEVGESREAEISLTLGDIARVDESGNTILYRGTYTLQIDVPAQHTVSFKLTGDDAMLDEWPQPPEDLGAEIE